VLVRVAVECWNESTPHRPTLRSSSSSMSLLLAERTRSERTKHCHSAAKSVQLWMCWREE
jgi:hypothetical protein